MLNKECLFGLLVDSMGKIYFPITNTGGGYNQTIYVRYITKWVELPEMTQGGGRHKYPVVFFRSYQLNNMVCINRIKFKKRA